MRIKQSNRGSVLIVALIFLTFLSTIAVHMAFTLKLETGSLNSYKQKSNAARLAQMALWDVIEDLKDDAEDNGYDYNGELWQKKFQDSRGKLRKVPLRNLNRQRVGEYSAYIVDESQKININKTVLTPLVKLLSSFKRVNPDRLAQEMIAYREAKEPAKIYYSVAETLRHKSNDEDIFLGEDINNNGLLDEEEDDGDRQWPIDNNNGKLDLGIKDYLTVHTDGKINLNTAPKKVLLTIPEVKEEIAELIIKKRGQQPFTHLDDLKQVELINGKVFESLVRMGTVRSNWHQIYITAWDRDHQQTHEILAVVDRSTTPPEILYWREN